MNKLNKFFRFLITPSGIIIILLVWILLTINRLEQKIDHLERSALTSGDVKYAINDSGIFNVLDDLKNDIDGLKRSSRY